MLIDFFNRDAVHKGMSINFDSKAGTGSWYFKNIMGLPRNDSLIQIANMDISYDVGSTCFSYETRRAFFRKGAIESWCKETFADYETTFSDPLIYEDPSFLVKLRRIGDIR